MSINKDYYLIEGTLSEEQQMFALDKEKYEKGFNDICLLKSRPIENEIIIPLKVKDFNKPFKLVDLHETPEKVFHKRIAETLINLEIYGVNFLKTKVRINQDEYDHNYLYMHGYNEIEAMDLDESVYRKPGMLMFIDKLVLDEEKLTKIPLENRLIFILGESTDKYLFHQSIVDEIKKLTPVGIKFYRVDEWDVGAAFR